MHVHKFLYIHIHTTDTKVSFSAILIDSSTTEGLGQKERGKSSDSKSPVIREDSVLAIGWFGHLHKLQ